MTDKKLEEIMSECADLLDRLMNTDEFEGIYEFIVLKAVKNALMHRQPLENKWKRDNETSMDAPEGEDKDAQTEGPEVF